MTGARDILAALSVGNAIDAPVALIAAHPDDETIGAGASLRLFRNLLLVHVTDGAPRGDGDPSGNRSAGYAGTRRRELAQALAAGDANPTLAELAAPDQEASLDMVRLADALAARLARFRPVMVIARAYEGGHPDHDAAALITQHASLRLDPIPTIVEMTAYHAGLGGELIIGGFIGDPAAVVVTLDAAQLARRRAMLDCFATQRATLAPFRDAEHEAFRIAPAYDFTAPPHPGRLCTSTTRTTPLPA